MRFWTAVLVAAICLVVATPAAFADVNLTAWAFNIDGTYYGSGGGYPPGVGLSSPDPLDTSITGMGLGTITFQFNTPGAHTILAGFYHELNLFTNPDMDYGQALGAAPTGLSWLLALPGDVQSAVAAGSLPSLQTADVSSTGVGSGWSVGQALGWNFNLGATETATVVFRFGTTDPGGFRLHQWNTGVDNDGNPPLDNPVDLYMSSTKTISGGGGPTVPEPATTCGAVLLVLALAARRRLANR